MKFEKKKFEKLNAREATLIKLMYQNGYIIDLFEQDAQRIQKFLSSHKNELNLINKAQFSIEDFYNPERNLFDCSYEKLLQIAIDFFMSIRP